MTQAKQKILILAEGSVTMGSLIASLKKEFNEKSYEIKPVRGKEMLDGKLLNKDVHAVIFPGVQDSHNSYRHALTPALCQEIKKYIHDGGTFLGLCAGAYLSTEKFFYHDKKNGKTKKVYSPLPLFEGTAYGPIPEYTPAFDDFDDPVANNFVVKLVFNQAASNGAKYGASCYSLGPYIKLDPSKTKESEYQIIARYKDIPGNPIAIVKREIGKGQAIFCGVVPEISISDMPDINRHMKKILKPAAQKFVKDLRHNEHGRKQTWQILMHHFKTRLI
jgi:glutamine amidotransferase-like uncharacterized protein